MTIIFCFDDRVCLQMKFDKELPTALAGKPKQLVASVCLSVRLSVRLFPLCLLNPLTVELEFVCGGGVIIVARMGLKVKVIGHGQRLMSSAYEHGDAVTRSV